MKDFSRAFLQSFDKVTARAHILSRAVDEIGHNWARVSTHVGRFATDCRDRYKNHLSERDTRNTGALGLLFSWRSSADMVVVG